MIFKDIELNDFPKAVCVTENDDYPVIIKLYNNSVELIKLTLLEAYTGDIGCIAAEQQESVRELILRFEGTVGAHNALTFMQWVSKQNLTELIQWYNTNYFAVDTSDVLCNTLTEAVDWIKNNPEKAKLIKKINSDDVTAVTYSNSSKLVSALLEADYDKDANSVQKPSVGCYIRIKHYLNSIDVYKYSEIKALLSTLKLNSVETEEEICDFVFVEILKNQPLVEEILC